MIRKKEHYKGRGKYDRYAIATEQKNKRSLAEEYVKKSAAENSAPRRI